jgi:hypothetical protein
MIGIGTILYGYCDGFFGDSYGEKIIEAMGSDWVVVRTQFYGEFVPRFDSFEDGYKEQMQELLEKWSIKPE